MYKHKAQNVIAYLRCYMRQDGACDDAANDRCQVRIGFKDVTATPNDIATYRAGTQTSFTAPSSFGTSNANADNGLARLAYDATVDTYFLLETKVDISGLTDNRIYSVQIQQKGGNNNTTNRTSTMTGIYVSVTGFDD